jgi:undecaprenyl-diphosphatase
MSLFQALFLGLIQGATEFIPVSSSGHLVLVPWLFGWEAPTLAFDTTVHWGTLVAILAVFWRDLWALIVAAVFSVLGALGKEYEYDETNARMAWAIALASVPAVVAGVLFQDFFENLFGEPTAAAVLLLVTAGILAFSEWTSRQDRPLKQLGWLDAVLVGVAQAFAIMPGISRSGATIAAALARGIRREDAARFSFLLSTPVVFGAGLLGLMDLIQAGGLASSAGTLLIGFASAAVMGYLCIRWLLGFLARRPLYVFSVYCCLFGLFCLGVAVFR